MSNKEALLAVTGGIGFIGNNLVRRLNEMGYANILIVDELDSSEKWKNLDGLLFEDYMDKSEFMDAIRSKSDLPISAVFHLGACSSTTETDSGYLMENNYHYTRRLCEWCLERGVRFITASSAATYGDGRLGYSDFDSKTSAYSPLNMYGMSKHIFDKWAVRHGIYRKIVGLKFFNVYGPHECHKGDMRSVVWKAFQQIREEGRVELFKSYNPEYADGEFVRDFVYVDDAVKVMLYFWQHSDINGLFNCGTGRARSWNDLAKAVFAALGLPPNIVYKEMPESLRPKYQYFTQANLTKLRGCGYAEEFTSLEDGVAKYVAWLCRAYQVNCPGAEAAAEPEAAAGKETAEQVCPAAGEASECAAENGGTIVTVEEAAETVCSAAAEAPECADASCKAVAEVKEAAEQVCPAAGEASECAAENGETIVTVEEAAETVCSAAAEAPECADEKAVVCEAEEETAEPVCSDAAEETGCAAENVAVCGTAEETVEIELGAAAAEDIPVCAAAEGIDSGAAQKTACRVEPIDDEALIKAVLTDITDGLIIRKDGLSVLMLCNLYGVEETQAERIADDLEKKGYLGPRNEAGMREILW